MARENWVDRVLAAGIEVVGDLTVRGVTPLEDDELGTFFSQLNRRCPELRKQAVHIKLEGKRNRSQITQDRKKGVLNKGVSDIAIFVVPGISIELKCANYQQSDIEPEQVAFLSRSQKYGQYVCVALGYKAALDWLEPIAVELGFEWQRELEL